MDAGGSDGEDDFPSSTAPAKKLKFHKKISEDSDAVDHASIPRKLRSVIKKRSCHAVSLPQPNSKRINHLNGSQTTVKECPKKSKPNTLACYPLTNDEQEVAEALFALAGEAPRDVTPFANKSEDTPLSSQGPSVQEGVAEVTRNPSSEESPKQSMRVDDLVKSTVLSQSNLSEAIKPDMGLRSFTIQANHQSLAKLNSGTMPNEFEQTGALLFPRVSENTGNLLGQDRKNHGSSTQSKDSGSKLLPGLYSNASSGSAGDHGSLPLQHSAAKIPFWLRPVASSSEPSPSQSQAANKTEHKAETLNRKIKSGCATHIYISRFIQSSQNSVGKEIPLLTTHHFRPSEALTTNVHQPLNHLISEGNGSTKTVRDSFSQKNLLDASRLTHLQEQSPLPPGNSTSKQCYDFLSLSTGGGRVESKADHPVEPPVPKFQHLNRFNSAISLPLPPNLLPSNLYQHHQLSASVAPLHLRPNLAQPNTYYNLPSSSSSSKPQAPVSQVHLQFPPYFSSTSSMTSQQGAQLRPPQQQHPTWTTQLPPQLPTQYQVPHWQIPRQEPQPVPPSVHFAKYLHVAEHHQMLRFPPPFPPIRASAVHSPLPVSCDKGAS